MAIESIDKIHVYFMPGLAASPEIFEHIALPSEQFQMHFLQWQIPEPDMSFETYAKRMSLEVREKDAVLVGVSFGGMLVQQMALYLKLRKLIIVSSIKASSEKPRRLRLARKTSLHKLLPTGMVNNVELLAKFALGETVNKRLSLYEKYLAVREKTYLKWALHHVIHWREPNAKIPVVHIHGDKDAVFPAKYIRNCIWVPGGTHTMIIHRYKWFNERLPAIILEERSCI